MEKSLFILLFYTGVVPQILSLSRKYYLIQQGQTWNDAQAYCRAMYSDLATVEGDADMEKLQNVAQRNHFNSSAWIGLYNDINSWRWSLGNQPLGTMTKWNSIEPNNAGGHQECGAISPWGLLDRTCAEANTFICFDDRKNGNDRYIHISNLMTWQNAQRYCREKHTDLASSRDETENSVIMGMTTAATCFGLFRDSWKWSDKTTLSTITWMPGKPDNNLKNENCAYLNNSQAIDALCSDIKPFFCYAIIRKNQFIRLKILSDQYANNSAVKTAILEKIKQKMKDHGIEGNTMVKWREHPGGVVFYTEKADNL